MYFATVVWPTSMPSLRSSPWMRGAPHSGFATLISRMSWRISPGARGRPPRVLDFQRHQARNPARCHLMMVSGFALADAKTVPIAVGITQRNYPLCTPEPSIALRPDFSYCIPGNPCLFNCPLHLTATKRSQTSGTAVGTVSLKSEAASRSVRMLRTAMGPTITGWLEDPAIVEVMLNPDGRLWIDRLTGGLSDTGKRLSAQDGERIVRVVAHHVGAEVHPGSPRLSAELPETGERFEGRIPPIVAAPAFAIRKPAVAIFTLADYARTGIMRAEQAELLCDAVSERRNILTDGGTSTGKTTLVNALLAEVARTADRVVLIEDTRELQCNAPNLVALRTKDGVASLSDLVRSSLRLRPDRIPVGEVRGAEAPELLKAWGTSHPGEIGTIHAGSAIGALRRLEQLIQEAVVTVPR